MTEDIADFVISFSLNAAPAELLPRVREAFLDSFGVMLAGSCEESAQIAARWVRDQGDSFCPEGSVCSAFKCGAGQRRRGAYAGL